MLFKKKSQEFHSCLVSSCSQFDDKNEHLAIFQWFWDNPLASSHFSVQRNSKSPLGLGNLCLLIEEGLLWPRKRRILEQLLLPSEMDSAIPILGRFGGYWSSQIFTDTVTSIRKWLSPVLCNRGFCYQKAERKWIVFPHLNFASPKDKGKGKESIHCLNIALWTGVLWTFFMV